MMPMTNRGVWANKGTRRSNGNEAASNAVGMPSKCPVCPKRKYQKINAVAEAATAARFVFTAITEIRRSDAQGWSRG